MKQSFEVSISEENRKMLDVIQDLRDKRINVSDFICKAVIARYNRALQAKEDAELQLRRIESLE